MPDEEWWGYSQNYGWVVLDRSNPANQLAKSAYHPLTFVRCDDWSEFTELKIKWEAPHFLYAPLYIRRLRGSSVRDAKYHLQALKDEWPQQKHRLKHQRLDIIRRKTLEAAHACKQQEEAARRAKEKEQSETKEFILSREIKTIIHFTHIENLDSILNHGLLPRAMAKELELDILTTDDLRLDHNLNAVNLSISFPNYKMFFKKQQNDTYKDWAVLCLKPNVLWEHECSFFSGNAADPSYRDKISGQRIEDLENMFAKEAVNCKGEPIHRNQLGIPDSYTTDPQAEVLAHGPINANYIFGICFKSNYLKNAWEQELIRRRSSIKAYEYRDYFNARIDFKHWPRKTHDDY